MHKSIAIYAKALGCTAGQIRRHIRKNKIPSARLLRSPVGRPSWMITDCSPEAIADLKTRIPPTRRLPRPLMFQEVVRVRTVDQTSAGKLIPSFEIMWQPMWRTREGLVIGGHDVIMRLALLAEGLSWDDLRNPPTVMHAGLRRVQPPHQEKIERFEQRYREYLRKWVSPRSTKEQKEIERLLADLDRANVMEAAEYLALYHRRYDIPITHRNLARVLGISKSSLYRQYGRELIQSALLEARLAATSATQGMIKIRSELD